MKTAIFILGLITLGSAAPKVNHLGFRNGFRKPVVPIENKPNSRIINGHEASPHSIPYIAFLDVYSDLYGWYCGGSLITVNYVITAGHCGYEALEAYILLGAHTPQQNEDTQIQAHSNQITVHENYNDDTLENDISVMKLSESVQLTNSIQLIPLPSRNDASNDYVNAIARTSGWGLTDGKGDDLSSVLLYIDVKVISNSECGATFGSLSSAYLCTSGEDNTSPCSGDSGGPLAADGVLIGVTSFGVEDCAVGSPAGFARVTTYLDWLSDKTDVNIS